VSSDGLRAEALDALTVRLGRLLPFLHRTDRACSRHRLTPQLYHLPLLVAAAEVEAPVVAELPTLLEIAGAAQRIPRWHGKYRMSANKPGGRPMEPIEFEWAEPGIRQGQ
jgi:hypothetical protein